MISAEKHREIVELLARGESQRNTARLAGVSRGLVNNVANGRRREPADREDELLPAGPFVWCEACQAKVQMPCVACRARGERKGRGLVHVCDVLREMAAESPSLGLELKPEDAGRYEEVKKGDGVTG